MPFYWVTLYCRLLRRCFSYYWEYFFIPGVKGFFGDELKRRDMRDKKFIILSEIRKKLILISETSKI